MFSIFLIILFIVLVLILIFYKIFKLPNSINPANVKQEKVRTIKLNLPENKIKNIENALYYNNNQKTLLTGFDYNKISDKYNLVKLNYLKNCLNIKNGFILEEILNNKKLLHELKNKENIKFYYLDGILERNIFNNGLYFKRIKPSGCLAYKRNVLGQIIKANKITTGNALKMDNKYFLIKKIIKRLKLNSKKVKIYKIKYFNDGK